MYLVCLEGKQLKLQESVMIKILHKYSNRLNVDTNQEGLSHMLQGISYVTKSCGKTL